MKNNQQQLQHVAVTQEVPLDSATVTSQKIVVVTKKAATKKASKQTATPEAPAMKKNQYMLKHVAVMEEAPVDSAKVTAKKKVLVTKNAGGTPGPDGRQHEIIMVVRDKLSRKWGWSLTPNDEFIQFSNIKAGTPSAQSRLLVGMKLHSIDGVLVTGLPDVADKIKNLLSVRVGVWYLHGETVPRKIEGELYRCNRHWTTPEKWQAVPNTSRKYWSSQQFLLGATCCGQPRQVGQREARTRCPLIGIQLCRTADPLGNMFYYCQLCKEEFEELPTIEEKRSVKVLCWKCNVARIEEESGTKKSGRLATRRA